MYINGDERSEIKNLEKRSRKNEKKKSSFVKTPHHRQKSFCERILFKKKKREREREEHEERETREKKRERERERREEKRHFILLQHILPPLKKDNTEKERERERTDTDEFTWQL